MKKGLILFGVLICSIGAFAQHKVQIIVRDSLTAEPLIGASVSIADLHLAASTNTSGEVVFNNVPDGKYRLQCSYIGYYSKGDSLAIAAAATKPVFIFLKPKEGEELEEVMVSSTRSSRTISNIATRIEVIAGEELDEKGNMKPGDIRMLLNESTGIQTQQTSATSANASIRIQGLDGRYTQILKDGFPVFSGAAAGLGLLQTPPLDLKQVEVIKGSASTLFGGGAIAGLVNLISKTPQDERELSFQANGTSAGGLDLNSFYSQKFGSTGLSLFAARNSNRAYAPEKSDFTAIPEFTRYTFNPKIFIGLGRKTELSLGINTSFEDRTGGDLNYIRNGNDPNHSFYEKNVSRRLSEQLAVTHKLREGVTLNLRNSLSYFNRRISIPGYNFNGSQYATFTELNYSSAKEKSEWVGGANLWTDQFKENRQTLVPLRNYTQTTFGAFVQNNSHLARWLELESGLRGDYVLNYGFALLPRVSALFKLSNNFNSRIGGGLGYKTPTIFTEESERVQYQNVLPLSEEAAKLEKSYGFNWDLNYRTSFLQDQLSLSINHLFFYTFLNNPLSMELKEPGRYNFVNLDAHIDSRGMETNLKLAYQDFKLFLGYSLTDAKIHQGIVLRTNPLTAKHRLNNVLMYEADDKWKVGLEGYYYSRQKLNNGDTGKPYWIFGFMVERLWENFSLYINFENFTDTRQTRFGSIYSGSVTNPVFDDIYAPLDGFVVNGGVKLRF